MVMEGTCQTSVRMIIGYRATMTLPQGEKCVGRDYLYTLSFSGQTKVQFAYFAPQIRLGIRLMLIRLDSASPPQGIHAP